MSFEAAGVGKQVLDNIYGLVANMRDNANSYIAAANAVQGGTAQAGVTFTSIATLMRADANAYIARINLMVNFATNNAALFSSALAVYGLTTTEATSLKNTLLSVCNHTLAASLIDQASITTEANFILANVPNFTRLW